MAWVKPPIFPIEITEGDIIPCGDDAWISQPMQFKKVEESPSELAVLDIIEQEVCHSVPEANLAAAVMLLARADVSRDIQPSWALEEIQDAILDARSAYRWFESDDFEYPYSFRNICKYLSIPHRIARDSARKIYSYYVLKYLVT